MVTAHFFVLFSFPETCLLPVLCPHRQQIVATSPRYIPTFVCPLFDSKKFPQFHSQPHNSAAKLSYFDIDGPGINLFLNVPVEFVTQLLFGGGVRPPWRTQPQPQTGQ